MTIDTSFIAENITGGDYTAESMLDVLNTTDDLELGRRLLPVAMNARGDDEATGDEAEAVWKEWGAAWRSAANEWLAEQQLEAEEDIEGMFPIIPAEEIGGLHADGYHFEVVNLSRENWAARVNGQDHDGEWALYTDLDDLKEAYVAALEGWQSSLESQRHEQAINEAAWND